MRPGQAVRAALDHYRPAPSDQRTRTRATGGEWHDPVGVTVHDQRRYVDARQVGTEVGQPGGDAVRCALRGSAGRNVPTEPNDLVADAVTAQEVDVVEIGEKGGQERQPIP